MAITATAPGVSASITARRPSWADMRKHYPDKNIRTEVLYDTMIGGRFKGAYKLAAYENTCAVRMSYALNRSGLKMGEAPSTDGSPKGADGYRYWIRVSDLKPHLIKQFKGADEELTLPTIPASMIGNVPAMREKYSKRRDLAQAWLDTKLAGRNGIVVFDVTGWGNASGHFTLWDGKAKSLAYANGHDSPADNTYYFWLTKLEEDKDGNQWLVQVSSIKFWELK
ncbi:MAG: T6SS effector amidase Tae4 family protein [Pseudomonadota bacterium]